VARSVNLKRDRFLFYFGLVLFLIGGPGMAVGTFAHDSLRVPVGGVAYDAFGWVNQTFLVVGAVVLVIGLVFLIIGLRGGVLSPAEVEDLKAGRTRT
jgi:hypothetical protein